MKIVAIILREYKQIVKKKSFIIATILTPALMAGFIFIPMLLTKVGREEKVIKIADYSDMIRADFIKLSGNNEYIKDKLKLRFISDKELIPEQDSLIKSYEKSIKEKRTEDFKLADSYKSEILDKKIDGLLIIPSDIEDSRRIYFCAQNISDFELNRFINSSVKKVLSTKIL
ncbi:MAG: hypothetical protein KAR14_04150, partial [Candidatus Aminicenantes bacterium]|nr:hypothetical protein [Candidatus Aminicenantes bacterium]